MRPEALAPQQPLDAQRGHRDQPLRTLRRRDFDRLLQKTDRHGRRELPERSRAGGREVDGREAGQFPHHRVLRRLRTSHQLRKDVAQKIGLGRGQQARGADHVLLRIARGEIERARMVELVALEAGRRIQLPTQHFDEDLVAVPLDALEQLRGQFMRAAGEYFHLVNPELYRGISAFRACIRNYQFL